MTHYFQKKGITQRQAPMYIAVYLYHRKNPALSISAIAKHFNCHDASVARIIEAMAESAWLVQVSQIKSITVESQV